MKLKRIIYNKILQEIKRKETSILIGPRQVGKTTILKELSLFCLRKKIRHRYFNLEIPTDASFFVRDFGILLKELCSVKNIILLDEFQYLPNATQFFKVVYDGYPGVKIIASGSSALEMHKHMKESLAGRRIIYKIYPLSFSEWLPSKTKNQMLPKSINDKPDNIAHKKLKKYLNDFLVYGGMPGLVHEKTDADKKRLLLDLVATYIQKDIKALLREEDVLSFNRLLSVLAANEGGLLSENAISGNLNYSLRQIRKDLTILNQMFLLYSLKPFSTNRTRELKQTTKTYFFDTGIRNAIINDFRSHEVRPDKGALLESFVFNEIQKNLKIAQEIYYWRTRQKDEVDFILIQDRVPLAIEVKSSIHKNEIPHGIKRFIDIYPECKMAVILNNDYYGKTIYSGKTVLFAPHYYAGLLPDCF